MVPGLLSGACGLLVATIGADPVTGDLRFTFDSFELSAGITLIAVIVGLFAYSEMFLRAARIDPSAAREKIRVGFRLPPLKEWRSRLGMLRSVSR